MLALVDIGSTFAKLTVVDEDGTVVARTRVLSAHPSLHTELTGTAGELDHACSSAGGGLRIAVIGLEPRLTVEAARRVAQGGGGRVVAAIAGHLDGDGSAALVASEPDVILLTGGTDGGERNAIVKNAHALARLGLPAAIVVAANADAADAAAGALQDSNHVRVVENVLPRIGILAEGAARSAIRDLFAEHVIQVARFPDANALEPLIRMPTPAAVLAATQLLSGLLGASVVVCDVGGATTDVHSVMHAERPGPVPNGHVTRTVEGDLGTRASASLLVEAAITEGLVERADRDRLHEAGRARSADPGLLPVDDRERAIDAELACLALTLALERHAGRLAVRLEAGGATLRPTGRDLRQADVVVVTGGVFEHAGDPVAIVAEAWRRGRKRNVLLSAEPTFIADRRYLLAAAGLLAESGGRSPATSLLLREFAGAVKTGARS